MCTERCYGIYDKPENKKQNKLCIPSSHIAWFLFVDFKKEYLKVSEGMGELKKSFDGDGCSDSQQLNEAIAETGRAYSDIATMWQQQVRGWEINLS